MINARHILPTITKKFSKPSRFFYPQELDTNMNSYCGFVYIFFCIPTHRTILLSRASVKLTVSSLHSMQRRHFNEYQLNLIKPAVYITGYNTVFHAENNLVTFYTRKIDQRIVKTRVLYTWKKKKNVNQICILYARVFNAKNLFSVSDERIIRVTAPLSYNKSRRVNFFLISKLDRNHHRV